MATKQPAASLADATRSQRPRARARSQDAATALRRAASARKREGERREKKSFVPALWTLWEEARTVWEDASTEAGDDESTATTSPAREEGGTPCGSPSGPPTAVESAAGAQPPGTAAASPRAAPAAWLEDGLVEQGLARLLVRKAAVAPAPTRPTPFQSRVPPGISIEDYVARVVRTSRCCSACVVASLVYLDRLMRSHPDIVISPLTCHRLVLTSIVLAIKFNDDASFSNVFYSKVGRVRLTDLNVMEMSFLELVDFRLSVSPGEYDLCRSLLLRAAQMDALSAPPTQGLPHF